MSLLHSSEASFYANLLLSAIWFFRIQGQGRETSSLQISRFQVLDAYPRFLKLTR